MPKHDAPKVTVGLNAWVPSTHAPLRHPFWRQVTIAIASFPLVVAISVSQFGVSFPLPKCLFQAVFGFPAPSCGLTRSFLALARGDWQTALQYHLFGPVLAALAAITVLLCGHELVTGRSHLSLYKRLCQPSVIVPFVGLLLAYYIFRLWVRYTLPTLPWGLTETSLWQHFLAGALAL